MRRALALALLAAGAAACRRATPACAGGARVALVAPAAPVGWDAAFTIEARPLCPEARAGTIRWRAVAGIETAALSVADGGSTVRARTPGLAAALGAAPPLSLIHISEPTRPY